MEKEQINFKQERDFGEVFNAAFSFIGKEFKTLFLSIIYYGLPFLIISGILTVLISLKQEEALSAFDRSAGAAVDVNNSLATLQVTIKYRFLGFLVNMFGMAPLLCIVYSYIKLYLEKGSSNFTLSDVWQRVTQKILPFYGTTYVVGLIVFIGFYLCLVPGFYFVTSLSLIFSIMIFEEKNFGTAFGESFTLTSNKWWLTFGIVIVSFLMVGIMSLLLSVPTILIFGLKSFIMSIKQGSADFPTSFYIAGAIVGILSYILYTIPFVILAFHYFSMKEAYVKPSLDDKIDQIN